MSLLVQVQDRAALLELKIKSICSKTLRNSGMQDVLRNRPVVIRNHYSVKEKKTSVTTILEFGRIVWSPLHRADIKAVEGVQAVAFIYNRYDCNFYPFTAL